ncbi:MAG: hypothetical protein NTY38_00625, partial [Acidobacteria bacterium]|nr:hypothetical protein [Acidobacteriota bacterium]
MNAALETLMLTFAGEGTLAVPANALFLGAQAHPALAHWPDLGGWQPLKPLAAAWDRAGLARVERPTGRYPLVL